MARHLCLDLDNTLIYASADYALISKLGLDKEENKYLLKRCRLIHIVDPMNDDPKGGGNITTLLIIFRPHLFTFLKFAKSYFSKISIWSAGQDRYVRAIESLLFPQNINSDHKKIPHKIYTFDDCHFLSDGTTFKELSKKHFNLTDTIALDDRLDTFSKNHENGILIPEYRPPVTKEGIMANDDALLKLMDWLLLPEVINATDIRKINKDHIFSSPISSPITPVTPISPITPIEHIDKNADNSIVPNNQDTQNN